MSTSHPDNLQILCPQVPTTDLTSDDSGSIVFGRILEVTLVAHRESDGFWIPWERQQIIELKTVQHGLQENLSFIQGIIQGQNILLFQDNRKVVACLTKFSSRRKCLMDELYHLVSLL